MKKTQLKDSLKNIRKQKVSFLSIIVIAAIGVTTFLGIDFTAAASRRNATDLYDALNFRDIEIISTLLFTEEDIESIRAVEGVVDVEPLLFTSANANFESESRNVSVLSLTERVNLPQIVEGRFPEVETECAAEKSFVDETGLKIGDSIRVAEAESGTERFLKSGEFVITGIVNHPDHTNAVADEAAYLLVTRGAFDKNVLDGCCMKAEVVIDKPAGINRFLSAYDRLVTRVTERLDDLAVTRVKERDDGLRSDWDAQIGENEQKLDDASRQLADARRQIDEKTEELQNGESRLADAEKQLAEGKEKLDDARVQIDSGRIRLDDARKTLDSERSKIDDGKAQLDAAAEKLDAGRKELVNGYNEIEDAKAEIRGVIRDTFESIFPNNTEIVWAEKQEADVDDPGLTARYLYITDTLKIDLNLSFNNILAPIVYSDRMPEKMLVAVYTATQKKDAPRLDDDSDYDYDSIRETLASAAASAFDWYTKLSDGCTAWDTGHDEYIKGLADYRSGLAEYEAGLKLFNAAQAQYESGVKEFEAGLAEFNAKKAEYDQGVADVEEGKKQLEEGRELLADGEAEYAKGLAEYNDGKIQLEEAQAAVDAIDPCRWLIIDGKGNAGFAQTLVGTDNFAKLKETFSLLFVIVGALVIFATVGKMVDEQRSQIGTTKALGFFNREIFAKYLGFGVSSTVIGTLIGVLTARFGIAPFLLKGFGEYAVFDMTKPLLDFKSSAVVLAAGIVLAAAGVWFASTKLLREPAVRLMQAKTPPGRKGQGKNSTLPLYTRLIILNMRTDLKRVVVTTVSVAGCCALIVTGLTLRSGVNGAADKQYGPITDYDLMVEFDPEISENAHTELETELRAAGTEFTDIFCTRATYRFTNIQVADMFCGDIRSIEELHHLNNWITGKPLFPTNEGVLIPRRIAEIYGLDIDSEFDLSVGGVKTATVRIAGIYENFIGETIVLSREYYKTIYGDAPVSNTFLVRLCGADAETLTDALRRIDGFESVKRSDTGRDIVETSSSMVNTVVVLFIFIAGIMAGVVLLNLTNMYIMQKKRELTIMRVNGFSVKEVKGYVLKETVVTTFLGIVIGIAAGSLIGYRIIRTLEQAFIQFDRDVNPLAWLIAACITVLFTVAVNTIALRKVKKLKLTDIA